MNVDVPANGHEAQSASQTQPKALTTRQERRLVSYLDEQFLQLTRGFKKRSEPSTHLPTLHHYLTSARQLLRFILQIPPVDPSTALRTAYLLHLTNDVLSSIPGYPPPIFSRTVASTFNAEERTEGVGTGDQQVIAELLDFLDDLDQAWVIVLQGKLWDAENDAVRDVDEREQHPENGMDEDEDSMEQQHRTTTPVSQTERTRLRSLLVGGMAALEEWIAGMGTGKRRLAGSSGMHVLDDDANDVHGHEHLTRSDEPEGINRGQIHAQEPDSHMQGVQETEGSLEEAVDGPQDVDETQAQLQKMGFQEEFDDLFKETLDELGGLGGVALDRDMTSLT